MEVLSRFNRYLSNNYIILVILVLISTLYIDICNAVPQKPPGYFARKLDEYFGTIKCMANIMEDLMPEPNTLVFCCGVWLMHDMMSSMVLDSCYEHNYHQVRNLTQPFIEHMEAQCWDYPRDAFACKFLIITPITILVLLILLMLTLSICAIVTCVRLRRYQSLYDFNKSQAFDSDITDETTDETAVQSMDVKKKPIDV
ncbi:uncharacterized protein LOC128951929 [Oppia nitens]|uniref:uncharacterized protein LOC128951929 n=1 Tax=Oppia nitens TaxID=1686743 RepID=UPI0023DAD8EA|nr:uncharacterized protein LOC128951929 [Oppia nitens]